MEVPELLFLLVMIVITVWIFFGNLLVLLAFLRNKQIRTIDNMIIGSLSSNDFLLSISVAPLAIFNYIASPQLRNYPCCLLWLCADVFMSTVSIWHLCSISYERFYCVVFPLKFMYKRKKRVKILILLSWLSGFFITLPLFIMASVDTTTIYRQELIMMIKNKTLSSETLLVVIPETHYLHSNETTSSNLNAYEMNCNYHNVYFSILSILFSFWIPLATMLTFTFITIGVLHKSKDKLEPRVKFKLIKTQNNNTQSVCSSSLGNGTLQNTLPSDSQEYCEIEASEKNCEKRKFLNIQSALGQSQHHRQLTTASIKKQNYVCKETEAQRRSLIVLIAFIIGYTPLFTLITISWFTPFQFSPLVFNILTWLGYLSSALNPSLYAWMNRNLKKALIVVITCKSLSSPRTYKRP